MYTFTNEQVDALLQTVDPLSCFDMAAIDRAVAAVAPDLPERQVGYQWSVEVNLDYAAARLNDTEFIVLATFPMEGMEPDRLLWSASPDSCKSVFYAS